MIRVSVFYNRQILIFNFSVVLTIPKATSQPSSIFKGDGETAAILGSSSRLHPPWGRPQLPPHCSTQHHWKAGHVTLAARSLTPSSVKRGMVGMGGGGAGAGEVVGTCYVSVAPRWWSAICALPALHTSPPGGARPNPQVGC